jgi:hypothetical protein
MPCQPRWQHSSIMLKLLLLLLLQVLLQAT